MITRSYGQEYALSYALDIELITCSHHCEQLRITASNGGEPNVDSHILLSDQRDRVGSYRNRGSSTHTQEFSSPQLACLQDFPFRVYLP